MRRTYVLKLALAGMFIALDIVFSRFLYAYLPPGFHEVRVSPQFLAYALAGWILGPVWAIGCAVAGDVLGMLINSAGLPILPGYMLSAALTGLVYAVCLYRRPVSAWRCLLAVAVSTLVISLCLGSLWAVLYYTQDHTTAMWLTKLLAALPWRLMCIPIYAVGVFLVQRGLSRERIPERFGFAR